MKWTRDWYGKKCIIKEINADGTKEGKKENKNRWTTLSTFY
jgi:hypothetical protein